MSMDMNRVGQYNNAHNAQGRSGGLSKSEADGRGNEFREAMRDAPDKSNESGSKKDSAVNADKTSADPKSDLKSDLKSGLKSDKDGLDTRSGMNTGEAPLFSGDALLRSLGSSYASSTQAVQTAGPVTDTQALAADLAERILVNTDNKAGSGEVRIALKDSVLPDTEIILRQDGNRLVVQLASGNASSLQTLHAAQRDLQDKLQSLGMESSVEVLDSRGDGTADQGQDRRSRGLDYMEHDQG